MSTTTANQVSSPYAIYENETKIASIPYEVLRVASQFVYKDYTKELLMGVHLKVENDEITGLRLLISSIPSEYVAISVLSEKFEYIKKIILRKVI